MKAAVIGSRSIRIENLGNYLPKNVTEIISGGAVGVDTCAREYANSKSIKLTEFLPDYNKYGRSAPLRRNIEIIENADFVLAFWDGASKSTAFVIKNCREKGVPIRVYRLKNQS